MKTDVERFTDAVAYLDRMVSSELAQHLEKTVRDGGGSKIDLGNELSLGSRSDKKKDADYDDNTQQRQALRALLLCQRVYFSKLWTTFTAGNTSTKVDALPADWATTSVNYWSTRSETDILAGIKVFTNPAPAATALVTAALAPGDGDLTLPVLTLTRATSPFPGHKFCYLAVMYWLFRSGIVSYRWMMRNYGGVDPERLNDIFGPGRVLWAGNRAFTAHDNFPAVPTGHIVHLYVNEQGALGGHWLVSTGNGQAYGRNNDFERGLPGGPVERSYDLCSLKNQFLAYKDTYQTPQGETKTQQGIAEVIDPLAIPARI